VHLQLYSLRARVGISTAAPYTESRLTCSVANERLGFPVVEQKHRDKEAEERKTKRKRGGDRRMDRDIDKREAETSVADVGREF
jgi:hypothetical protein